MCLVTYLHTLVANRIVYFHGGWPGIRNFPLQMRPWHTSSVVRDSSLRGGHIEAQSLMRSVKLRLMIFLIRLTRMLIIRH